VKARPLDARSIVVTRPAQQAGRLAQLIAEAGGRALRYPSIAIEPLDSAQLDAQIAQLASFDAAIFISRNAAEFGIAKVRAAGAFRSLPLAAALGSGTRTALESEGVRGVIAPEGMADSEALLELPALRNAAGKRILIFRGVGGRELLASALRARGAAVEYAECYRRARPSTDMRPLIAHWSRGEVDAVAISSAEGLLNFASLLGDSATERLRATPVFVPHPRVAEEARGLGIGEVIEAGAADEDMLRALVAYFGRAS
jgi:uroporphyrinogen-III synthase